MNNMVLNTARSITVAYSVCRRLGLWDALGAGFDGAVDDIAVDKQGRVWFVGNFTKAGGVTVNRITWWDGTTFHAIGGGTKGADGRVRAIVVDVNGEDVIFTGDFANVAGSAYARICKYDFSAGTFSGYGTGLNGSGYALCITRAGVLIVGGAFTTANGVTVNRLAYWTGATFGTYAEGGVTGMNGAVYALAESVAGWIVVGGAFTTGGGDTVNYCAYWTDTTHVYAMGDTPGVDGDVYTIEITPTDEWYLGGAFTTADGTTCNYIALFNSGGFSILTTGLDAAVYRLAYNPADRRLWVGGDFTKAGSNTAMTYLGTWSGTAWSHVDIDLPSGFTVTAIAFDGERVYIGGDDSGTGQTADDTTLTSLGTVGAPPIFTITRSGGTSAVIESFVNTTHGKRLVLRYALADGETVTINLETRKMTSDAFGEIIGNIFADSDVASWLVQRGENVVAAFVSTAGAPTVTAYAQWRDYYRSIDGAAA